MGAVKECLKTVKYANTKELLSVPRQLQKVERSTAAAKERLVNLLGFERSAIPVIERQVRRLEEERERLLRVQEFGQLPWLSLEPLTWRDKRGWPRLVVLSLNSPRFVLTGKVERNTSTGYTRYLTKIEPSLPKPIEACYRDVLSTLRKQAKKERSTITLATEYKGVIPPDVRKKILAAQNAKPAFNGIFIIAEVGEWAMTKVAAPKLKPREADPLVVGFDGANLWIIAKFDLTPVESLMLEFTV